jgi:hypothetical protein
MAQLGHTDPKFTLRLYAHMMRRRDGEKERLRALVEGAELPSLGTIAQTPRSAEVDAGVPENDETPGFPGVSGEADDGTRTHDLLHGKQTL